MIRSATGNKQGCFVFQTHAVDKIAISSFAEWLFVPCIPQTYNNLDHLYMESDYSQMQCDSVHACIQRTVRKMQKKLTIMLQEFKKEVLQMTKAATTTTECTPATFFSAFCESYCCMMVITLHLLHYSVSAVA